MVYPPKHSVSFVGMFWWIHYQYETLNDLNTLQSLDSTRLQPQRPVHETPKKTTPFHLNLYPFFSLVFLLLQRTLSLASSIVFSPL
jgi:hypothetical protein